MPRVHSPTAASTGKSQPRTSPAKKTEPKKTGAEALDYLRKNDVVAPP